MKKIGVLVIKDTGYSNYYSVFVYFDLLEYFFSVKRKPMKKYSASFIKKIISSPLSYKTLTHLKNEQDLKKRINDLKTINTLKFSVDSHLYYEQEI